MPDTSHFINSQELDRLTKISFDARVKEAEKSLASKTVVENTLDLGDKNRQKIEKLQTFVSGCFLGKSHFEDDERQNYLVFQPVFTYFKTPANSDMIIASKSKGLSEESIKRPALIDNSLNPGLNCIDYAKIRIKFNASCLKQ